MDRLVDWLVGGLVVDWLVGFFGGWTDGWLVVDWLGAGWLVDWLVDRLSVTGGDELKVHY